jgi:hypothetical protein
VTKSSDRILTRHPDSDKQGVSIDEARYGVMRAAITAELERAGGKDTFFGLRNKVARRLKGKFTGSVSWYYTVVKLDLEARGILERVPGTRPQVVRLAGKA